VLSSSQKVVRSLSNVRSVGPRWEELGEGPDEEGLGKQPD